MTMFGYPMVEYYVMCRVRKETVEVVMVVVVAYLVHLAPLVLQDHPE